MHLTYRKKDSKVKLVEPAEAGEAGAPGITCPFCRRSWAVPEATRKAIQREVVEWDFVVNAKSRALIIAEIELGEIPLQMLFAHVMIRSQVMAKSFIIATNVRPQIRYVKCIIPLGCRRGRL
jgi:hypothetical protein